MDTRKAHADLLAAVKAVRKVRADATGALDTMEDAVHETGPVVLGGIRNEELQQPLGAFRAQIESALQSLRAGLSIIEQLERVAHKYEEDGIAHPLTVPARPPKPEPEPETETPAPEASPATLDHRLVEKVEPPAPEAPVASGPAFHPRARRDDA